MRKLFTAISLLFITSQVLGQGGIISGRVFNPINNEPIPFANILVLDTELGTVSDENGNYILENIAPGLYNVRASFVGFRSKTTFEVQVTLAKSVQLDFGLIEEASELGEVLVSSEFTRSEETPLSVRKLNANEIERYPGGNRDISRVIQP